MTDQELVQQVSEALFAATSPQNRQQLLNAGRGVEDACDCPPTQTSAGPVLGPRSSTMAIVLAARTALVEHEIRSAAAILGKAGLRGVLLKGPTPGFHEPILKSRTFTDGDILLERLAFSKLDEIFGSQGWVRARTAWEPRGRHRIPAFHSASFISPRAICVDFHRVIPPSRWGARLAFEVLVRDGGVAEWGHLVVPSRNHCAMIASLQLVHDAGSADRAWLDLLYLLWGAGRTPTTRRDFLLSAAEMGIAPAVVGPYAAIANLHGERVPLAFSVRERRDLKLIQKTTQTWQRGDRAIAHIRGMSLRDRVRAISLHLFPDGEFLKHRVTEGELRGASLAAWWLEVARRLAHHPNDQTLGNSGPRR